MWAQSLGKLGGLIRGGGGGSVISLATVVFSKLQCNSFTYFTMFLETATDMRFIEYLPVWHTKGLVHTPRSTPHSAETTAESYRH